MQRTQNSQALQGHADAALSHLLSSPPSFLPFFLQMLLTEYLDMKNTRTASEPSAQLSYASSGREFAAFFAKKKPQRPKNPLFK